MFSESSGDPTRLENTLKVTLAANFPPERHAIHGLGWLRPWSVVRRGRSSILLEDSYAGDRDWPWPYAVHQHVALDNAGATVRLMVENTADEPAPLGIGLHPYFRRNAETTLCFTARSMLGTGADALPDGSVHASDVLAPFERGAKLPPRTIDHCFAGWGGHATITDDRGSISVRGFGAPFLHVYAPADHGALCLEPVSHSPDALNREPGEMAILPPGAAAGMAMRIEAVTHSKTTCRGHGDHRTEGRRSCPRRRNDRSADLPRRPLEPGEH